GRARSGRRARRRAPAAARRRTTRAAVEVEVAEAGVALRTRAAAAARTGRRGLVAALAAAAARERRDGLLHDVRRDQDHQLARVRDLGVVREEVLDERDLAEPRDDLVVLVERLAHQTAHQHFLAVAHLHLGLG